MIGLTACCMFVSLISLVLTSLVLQTLALMNNPQHRNLRAFLQRTIKILRMITTIIMLTCSSFTSFTIYPCVTTKQAHGTRRQPSGHVLSRQQFEIINRPTRLLCTYQTKIVCLATAMNTFIIHYLYVNIHYIS